MQKEKGLIRLSAGDLSKHLGCRFLTHLDWAHADSRVSKEYHTNLTLEALQERGMKHEKAYLDFLKQQNLSVIRINNEESPQVDLLTVMKKGHDIIVQAVLSDERWTGRTDILKKVNRPSILGDWSYEVVDTKMARSTKAGTILQLCLYSELLSKIQGVEPKNMTVVAPGAEEPFLITEYRVQEYSAYFRKVRGSLQNTIKSHYIDIHNEQSIYPEPVPQCDFCDWWMWCKNKRKKDDHLSLVANITRTQKNELQAMKLSTLTSLARWQIPDKWYPSRGALEGYIKTQEQSQIQYESNQKNEVLYKTFPPQEGYGLAELPEPSPGDIFFDIEGDAFVGNQGLEYLLGFCVLDPQGDLNYRGIWSKSEAEEKTAFEQWIDFVFERLEKYPEMHIYHYAPYESGAAKRLMGKHATRESEVDSLLRMGKFIDLMKVVKRSMLVGIERYSIKELEILYKFQREVPLRKASTAIRRLEFMYETGQSNRLEHTIHQTVEGYNKDDCVSTRYLRDWLEKIRSELIEKGETMARPNQEKSAEPNEKINEKQKQIEKIRTKLMENIPDDIEEHNSGERARWILSQLMEFHRREEKSLWWEYFRLSELTDEELLHEKAALSGLEYLETVGGTEKNPVCRYTFPHQDFEIKMDTQARQTGGEHYGTFVNIEQAQGYVDIKKKQADNPHTHACFSFQHIPSNIQHESIMRLAEWTAEHGIDSPGEYRAVRDLLLRKSPRFNGNTNEHTISVKLKRDGESNADAAVRVASELERGVLAIQGPPGSGKTYLASKMIAHLVEQGKKIGVTALSHKVIRNLLEKTASDSIQCVQKVSKKTDDESGMVEEVTSYSQVKNKIKKNPLCVLGGTAWMWSKADFFESLDYLFIDEAAQFSLADTLAVSQAGMNLILLGDPQQLERPIQGVHPPYTDTSSLQHFMGKDSSTISEERGLFLEDTWRMHPGICSFISEQFYENKLKSRPECSVQKLEGSSLFSGTGLRYVSVKHEGNQSTSPEEAESVQQIYQELLQNSSWVNQHGEHQPLTNKDILIITPYNSQVRLLMEKLPHARIGTVDKFQGQEAAVVIYSLTTSTAEEAPRGMDFLYSHNRLNVAVSRARCLSVIVGSPSLFFAECSDPFQIRLANSFCRYQEKSVLL